ncbi:DExH-box ATP-dependent RNA helicase DExH17 [Magnolia sinica]|uniref:DExH-box ATP-dependent RNA helicase DExH17 n=1 Tax=Magnolia sinica TaxID=86752 RepID=UPI002657CD79|nr:DExH-box ATP-dependent RNA helicase DExH17 [Magnolia sinica]
MDSYALRSVSDLPAPFRPTFGFRYFNSLQSECFPGCFLSDQNMVISAPTGSGKTVLFELCILRLLSRFLSQDGKFNHIKGNFKTIYIAPSKALVQEKLRDWNLKLGSWGISCLELTGDNESYNVKNIQEADIILTTPEKFDAVTRHRIRDGGLSFFSDIALLLIDEVHLLNDPRGASLEAIVSRIKMLARNPEMRSSPLAHVRFLAVSATIPNIEDLAEWLMVPSEGIKRFGEEMRPVKLTTKVFGYASARNDFLFERRLQNFIFDILMQHSRGKSALVFCSTRRGAQEAAQCLCRTAMGLGHSNPFIKHREQPNRLKEASLSCSDKQMQSSILYGVGFHNGGLCLKDRNLIEGLFLNGDLQILCTTNTLAHGINLPAHTVVIKSTQYFNKEKGVYSEYDRSMILQMCGRAGRPPFEETGTVIIMTRRETVHLYENLLNGCEMVESQLLSCTTEHLNAEIVQLNVSDITLAIEWLKCSYLYVRIKKNPENYGLKRGIPCERLEKHMQGICLQKVNELSTYGMIWTDEYGFLLKPLEPGRLMTKYYLKFNTMKDIIQTTENSSLEDVLRTVCRSQEIAWIQLRRNEKKLLNDINTDKDGRLRFHILTENGKRKKRIQTREEKIFVLANDCLTGDPSIHDLSLNQDTNSICSNGCRIARCMKEFFIYKKCYRGALHSTLLAKSLHQRLWDDSPYLLKQLPGIGMVTAKALHSAGINSFKTMEEADPRRIEIITGRKYPFGNHIKESLLSLPPKVEMKAEEAECRRQGKSKLVITLTRLSQSISSVKRHYADMVIGSEENNMIFFYEKIRVEEFSSPYSATLLVSNPQQGKLTVKVHLIFEDYVGLDVHEKLVLTREANPNTMWARGDRQSAHTYSLPREIYVVDDDNNNTCSRAPTEEPQILSKSKRVISSMPSFNLLQEDIEEGFPAPETEECGSEAINQQTVFDHIRKKAKNFPLFSTSATENSSPSRALLPTRKATEKVGMNGIQREIVILPDSEPMVTTADFSISKISPTGMIQMNGLDNHIDENTAPEYHMISRSFSNGKAELSAGIKSRPFSDISTLQADVWESGQRRASPLKEKHHSPKESAAVCMRDEGQSSKNDVSSNCFTDIKATLNDLTDIKMDIKKPFSDIQLHPSSKDRNAVENSAQGRDVISGSLITDGKSELGFLVSNAVNDRTETKQLFSDIFAVKPDVCETGWQRSPPLKQQEMISKEMNTIGRREAEKQCCSLATSGKEIGVSFLGVKSVFSFL